MENTLLRVAGALFCHDTKRAPTHTKQIELNSGVSEKRVVIRPDPELGQPGPLAHKLFVALIKKHSGRAPGAGGVFGEGDQEIGLLDAID